MARPSVTIRQYQTHDAPSVARIWDSSFGAGTEHNAAPLAISKKVEQADGLFFVAELDGAVIGTIMAGYDGHRGWIYCLAVGADMRRQGIGKRLIAAAEAELVKRGCLKVNLQVRNGPGNASDFYRNCGYSVEDRISFGKKLY
jgi:ribosomal protein S18 acetylase RimI-like enzyme